MTEITLLDGGIGQELVKRSGRAPTPFWSTMVLLEMPEIVSGLHRDYFAAGATVATTNTYGLHRDRVVDTELEPLLEQLTQVAVDQAVQSKDASGTGRVAGALGPLGASYRPDICPPPDKAADLYAELATRLGDDVDILLLETIPSLEAAEGALMGLAHQAKPVWLGVTVDDDNGTLLRSGEPLAGLQDLLKRYRPDAVLINCSRPEAVTQALPIAAGFGLPFGAYANGFTKISDGFLQAKPTVDALSARTDLDPAAYADFAMAWVGAGATIIGGCCETGPDHIAEIATRLRAAGHTIV